MCVATVLTRCHIMVPAMGQLLLERRSVAFEWTCDEHVATAHLAARNLPGMEAGARVRGACGTGYGGTADSEG